MEVATHAQKCSTEGCGGDGLQMFGGECFACHDRRARGRLETEASERERKKTEDERAARRTGILTAIEVLNAELQRLEEEHA